METKHPKKRSIVGAVNIGRVIYIKKCNKYKLDLHTHKIWKDSFTKLGIQLLRKKK
jgi:hypothetical protein